MGSEEIVPGQVVQSRAGRDKDNYFLVVGIVNYEYVLICDGDIRKVEKPKKKKVKHLIIHNNVAEQIRNKLKANIKINNGEIRNSLESMGLVNQYNSKEV